MSLSPTLLLSRYDLNNVERDEKIPNHYHHHHHHHHHYHRRHHDHRHLWQNITLSCHLSGYTLLDLTCFSLNPTPPLEYMYIQSHFNGSKMFGTTETSSRHG